MGWTYLHKDKDMNTKDFFSKEFNFIDKRGRKVTVLDCASYLTEAYLAIESLTPGEERMVLGMVCLIHYTKNDYHNVDIRIWKRVWVRTIIIVRNEYSNF